MSGVILKGKLTPQLAGRAARRAALSPGIFEAVFLRHVHAACRSGVLFAWSLMRLTPSQHGWGTATPSGPVRYARHGATVICSVLHGITASAKGIISPKPTISTTTTQVTCKTRGLAMIQKGWGRKLQLKEWNWGCGLWIFRGVFMQVRDSTLVR